MSQISDYDDLIWCSKNKFGSGVAKAMIWRIATDGWGLYAGLDYEELADCHEFTVEEIRLAVAHLLVNGFARIEHDLYAVEGEVLLLLSPGRLAEDRAAKAEAEAKAAKRAAKIALRGGRVRRSAIPQDVRNFVFARDGHACQRCDATTDLTLDHKKPWSLGGSDEAENLQTLCRPCNSKKGDRL